MEENNGGNESKLRGSLVYILTAVSGRPGHLKPSTGFMPVNMTEQLGREPSRQETMKMSGEIVKLSLFFEEVSSIHLNA